MAMELEPGGMNDLEPGAPALNRPVQIDPETHYGDRFPLWMANQYRPQLVFYEDMIQAANYRLFFQPE